MIFDRNKVISKKLKSELNLKYRKGVRSKSSRSIISAGGGGGMRIFFLFFRMSSFK